MRRWGMCEFTSVLKKRWRWWSAWLRRWDDKAISVELMNCVMYEIKSLHASYNSAKSVEMTKVCTQKGNCDFNYYSCCSSLSLTVLVLTLGKLYWDIFVSCALPCLLYRLRWLRCFLRERAPIFRFLHCSFSWVEKKKKYFAISYESVFFQV